MQASERLRQPFLIPRQTAKARGPGVTPFDHPPAGQRHKALFGLGQLAHPQAHRLGVGILGGLLAGIPLVDKRHFDGVARDFVPFRSQGCDLAPVLLVGGGDMEG